MTSVFNPNQSPSAESTLQRGFDDSARAALEALRVLLRQQEASAPFPLPNLETLAAQGQPPTTVPGEFVAPSGQLGWPPRNDEPDPQRAGLETQVVAQTAAVLAEAYGHQGSYQAQHYRVETLKPRQGLTRQVLYDRNDQHILTFDREGAERSIRDDQLSEAHKTAFLAAAQILDQQGLPESPQRASELLGALGPASSRAEYQDRVRQSAQNQQARDAFTTMVRPTLQQAHQQEQAKVPVTAHDLAEWRMASVTLGRSATQVKAIEAHGHSAAQLAGAADFHQLYHRNKAAPLPLQLPPEQRSLLDQELAQFRDLVRQNGPRSVERLYHLQSTAESPTWIAQNSQLRPTTTSPTETLNRERR